MLTLLGWLYAQEALAESAEDQAPETVQPAFWAGSYGRVSASTDLAGGRGAALNVVRFRPRLDLDPYLELDFGWDLQLPEGPRFGVVVTPALSGDLFHYDGVWGQDLAVRNLYATVDGVGGAPLGFWAGSRMYRGDDVYLLDFWPLDELNTVGGGTSWSSPWVDVEAHVGFNRLVGDDWQVQWLRMAVPDRVDGEEVLVLDRQRTIASMRVGRELAAGDLTLRGRLYGELHRLPEGARFLDDPFDALREESLPADRGALYGAQLSAWGWAPDAFAHLWVRYASGLAAFGELAIPVDSLDADLQATGARNLLAALAGHTQVEPFSVVWGAYVMLHEDATGIPFNFQDRLELVGVVRPEFALNRYISLAGELSHQHVRPGGVNPRTDQHDRPSITKLSLLPGLQAGRGGLARPRVQATYTATFLDEDARRFLSPHDRRIAHGVQHFVGLGAEWWINSTRQVTP